MKIAFQKNPWDLYICFIYESLAAVFLLLSNSGSVVALPMVLFVPGYFTVAAIFPQDGEMGWIQRIALSMGLSLAIVPFLGLSLGFASWEVRFVPSLVIINLFIVLMGSLAHIRRRGAAPTTRLSLRLELRMPALKGASRLDQALISGFVVSVAVAAAVGSYVVFSPHPDRFTEIFLLDTAGNASAYPTSLKLHEPGGLIVGIANREAQTMSYSIRVDLVGVMLVRNVTSGANQTLETNRTTLSWLGATLSDGQEWKQPYTFWINSTGYWKLQFLLFKWGQPTNQEVYLLLRALPP